MTLTKKDFEKMAWILGTYDADQKIVFQVAKWCAEENDFFDVDRFSNAIQKAKDEKQLRLSKLFIVSDT